MNFFAAVGGLFSAFCAYLGQVGELAAETFRSVCSGRIRVGLTLRQISHIGFGSQMVVIVTGAFTGAVFTAQTYFQFARLNMESAVGPVISVAMCRELGPVLTGLMVAGRVGAAMSAELGTMKVTQQIDALRALAVHPVDYLVVPRALAMLISIPLLVGECIFFGILAGYLVATKVLGVGSAYYLWNMYKFTDANDIFMGVIKGFVFAVIIVFVSCREGLHARDGAVGVGRATTEAVVIGSLSVLIANFFLTMFLNIFFPAGVNR
ncbi:MAG: ABC transporter permease [Terrimicrobiaceae bacterium]|nr:ABC transporter permease [Terrimicrobiaceae bacterium]